MPATRTPPRPPGLRDLVAGIILLIGALVVWVLTTAAVVIGVLELLQIEVV